MTNYDEWKSRLEKDPGYIQAIREIGPALDLADSIITLRLQRGLTIRQMARLARVRVREAEHIEYGIANPRLKTLVKLAGTLGARLEVRVVANDSAGNGNTEVAA